MKLIGTKRAAEILAVPPRTLRRWAALGSVPVAANVETTGGYLFDEDEILEVRSAHIAAKRAELDAIEAAS